MGLRRAHSKTMRETVRSRMKILTFLKDEGANILALAREGSSRGTGFSDSSTMAIGSDKASGTLSAQDHSSPKGMHVLAEEEDKTSALGSQLAMNEEEEKKAHKKDVDESFINQFRRASLDFVSSLIPKGLKRPCRSDDSPSPKGCK